MEKIPLILFLSICVIIEKYLVHDDEQKKFVFVFFFCQWKIFFTFIHFLFDNYKGKIVNLQIVSKNYYKILIDNG